MNPNKRIRCGGEDCTNTAKRSDMHRCKNENGMWIYLCGNCTTVCSQCYTTLGPTEAIITGAGLGCKDCAFECSECLDYFFEYEMYSDLLVCDYCPPTE